MTGTPFTGRGPSGPSIDQVIAAKLGGDSRFRSLQIGVSQESFGESMQRNMSWAGYERALPPEMIPHRLFDRLFGEREEGWVNRKRSILDAVRQDADRAEEEAAHRRSGARGRASLGHPRPGALHRRPAARIPARRSARFRRRHEGLAAHRETAERSAGAGAGYPADARGVLYVDQVPGTLAIPVARATRRRGITTTRTPTAKRRARTESKASACCAISASGTSRSSRTWWPS